MSTGAYSTARSHTGSKSIFITGAGRLRHSFDTALDRTVEVWFYDDGVGTFNIPLFGNLDVFAIGGGLNRAVSVTHYYFYDGASSQVSTVPLSTGWHCIQMHVTAAGTAAIIKIDNVEVYNGAIGATPQALVEMYNVGDSVYCDDVRVYSGIPQPVLVPVFQDDCENGLAGSVYTLAFGGGGLSYSTDQAYQGSRSLKVQSGGNEAAELALTQYTNRTYDWWFYDDGAGNRPYSGIGKVEDVEAIAIGVITGGANYEMYFPNDGAQTVTGIVRSVGWHHVQMYVGADTTIRVLVDGVEQYNAMHALPAGSAWNSAFAWYARCGTDSTYYDRIIIYDGNQT